MIKQTRTYGGFPNCYHVQEFWDNNELKIISERTGRELDKNSKEYDEVEAEHIINKLRNL